MVDATVEGARAQHDIDVLVESEKLGIRHRWVVECKLWKRRIPKERVLTLQGVLNDVGGDRGFLLCEVGFQSGAITAARSQASFTGLAELRQNVEFDAQNARLEQLVLVLTTLKGRYEEAKAMDRAAETPPDEGVIWVPTDEFTRRLGVVSVLEMSARQALVGRFPTIYGSGEFDPRGIGWADDLGALLERAEPRVAMLASWLDGHIASA
jgi:Restriction endonuclease